MQENPKPASRFNLQRLRLFAVVIIVGVLFFSAGYFLGADYKAKLSGHNVTISRETPERYDVDFALFWNVWDTLEQSYFDKSKIDSAELVWGAIRGMVAAVGDPYTVFLPPAENKVTQEDLQGSFEGVGIQIGYIGTQLAVVSPLTGSPAEAAGILAGDLIVGIRDEAKEIDRGTVGITLPEAVRIIRGPAGTSITLAIVREGTDEVMQIDVVRQSINVPSVTLSFVGENENVAHLQVSRFGGETLAEWDEAVLEILKKQDLAGVIVDVRNNPGGYLQGAVDLASEFIPRGEVVVIEEYANGSREEFLVDRMGRLSNEKIVIMVNGGSASASEILAGALRDVKSTPVIGKTSFGKGTIQESKQINGGSGLHVTVARWLTPKGIWVNENPIVPDFEVDNDPETIEDEQLNRAIEEILN